MSQLHEGVNAIGCGGEEHEGVWDCQWKYHVPVAEVVSGAGV